MEQESLKWVGLKLTFSPDRDNYFSKNLTFEWCKKVKRWYLKKEDEDLSEENFIKGQFYNMQRFYVKYLGEFHTV